MKTIIATIKIVLNKGILKKRTPELSASEQNSETKNLFSGQTPAPRETRTAANLPDSEIFHKRFFALFDRIEQNHAVHPLDTGRVTEFLPQAQQFTGTTAAQTRANTRAN